MKTFLFGAVLFGYSFVAAGQGSDSIPKPQSTSEKMEALFKIIPVPLYSHSTEAGDIFGLAKFNLFRLSKKDTVSRPSKLSEVFTISTKGRINFSVSNDLIFNEDKYMILSYINYKKQPEYIFGIGNNVSRDDLEQFQYSRWKFVSSIMRKSWKSLYAGVALDFANYYDIQLDSNSFVIEDNVAGKNGGNCVGVGFASAWDNRDNRYNPSKGSLVYGIFMRYPKSIGSDYQYSRFELDVRKYYKVFGKHIIALQATTSYRSDVVPFYELSLLGGEDKMRGYYKGAIRDKVLADAQVEYRFPVWKMLGMTTWVGTGRVAPTYDKLTLNGLWLSYGVGVRIRVDTKNNTNMRMDMGFGPGGINGFYINFAEAF